MKKQFKETKVTKDRELFVTNDDGDMYKDLVCDNCSGSVFRRTDEKPEYLDEVGNLTDMYNYGSLITPEGFSTKCCCGQSSYTPIVYIHEMDYEQIVWIDLREEVEEHDLEFDSELQEKIYLGKCPECSEVENFYYIYDSRKKVLNFELLCKKCNYKDEFSYPS